MTHRDSGWRPKGATEKYNGFEVWDHGVRPTEVNDAVVDGVISFDADGPKERSQDERDAHERIEALLEANREDAEALTGLARALDHLDASESDLVSQELLEQLADEDRAELANAAQQAALRAEGVDLADFPDLERALRRRGDRDATFFENVAAELRGDRELDLLLRQGVDADTVSNLREFHHDVLQEAIATAEDNAASLRGEAID